MDQVDAFNTIEPGLRELRTSSRTVSPFGYTGLWYDTETGFYYARARYYSPLLARFTQMDPIGYAGGSYNLYEWVGSNPIFEERPAWRYRPGGSVDVGGVDRAKAAWRVFPRNA